MISIVSDNLKVPNTKTHKMLVENKPSLEKVGSTNHLHYLNNSTQTVIGKQIAFASRFNAANYVTKLFNDTQLLPEYIKIPDGFKEFGQIFASVDDSAKLITNPLKCQITIVDRTKDNKLQRIIKDYNQNVKKWKDKFNQIAEKTNPKDMIYDWPTLLIDKTKYFIKQMDNPQLDRHKELEKFKGKETLLGDIFSMGTSVCRHKSILAKLLLDEHKVPSKIHSGWFLEINSPERYPVAAHTWNSIDLPNKGINNRLLDVEHNNFLEESIDGINLLKYYHFNTNHFSKNEFLVDLHSIQPDETIKIGLNKNGKLITDKNTKYAQFDLCLKWDKSGKIELKRLNRSQNIKVNGNGIDSKIVIDKDTEILYKNQYFQLSPWIISQNYKTRPFFGK